LSDNRKHERVDSRLRCWCEGQNVTFYARVGNLSEGGLFLRTSTPLLEGTEAVVRLETREQAEISARARVMWARNEGNGHPPGMGLRFEQIDERALEVIRRIIENEQRTQTDRAVGG
jgi:uncharacterized protein (TIGR02266 family)